MKPPKHILVPVDMSVFSITALQYAQDIAELFEADVTIVHVAENGEKEKTRSHSDADPRLKSTIAHLLMDRNLVTRSVTIEIRHGSPAQEIVKASRDLNTDLVVMCTHGRSGLSHMLMGSVAEKVVRTAACPVLTLKPDEFRELINVTDEDIKESLHLS
ncbi:MAG: universal stress protein [Ignavibacteriales bacterium]|nr:universal stress protein [Ignavibacteriales bacterium]